MWRQRSKYARWPVVSFSQIQSPCWRCSAPSRRELLVPLDCLQFLCCGDFFLWLLLQILNVNVTCVWSKVYETGSFVQVWDAKAGESEFEPCWLRLTADPSEPSVLHTCHGILFICPFSGQVKVWFSLGIENFLWRTLRCGYCFTLRINTTTYIGQTKEQTALFVTTIALL